jgi:hypothetical protein
MIDWLNTPLSGTPTHTIEPWAYWHARCMVGAWSVLLPIGALAARYFKVRPGQDWPRQLDDKVWWHAHRGLQWSGVLLMTLGAALSLNQGTHAGALAVLHASFGWILLMMGWLQVAVGLLRGSKGGPTKPDLRGDHYDMTTRRLWFERVHKRLGWATLLCAIVVTAMGLLLSDAPRWMALGLGAWWTLLASVAWRWERQGRCVGTYQAI